MEKVIISSPDELSNLIENSLKKVLAQSNTQTGESDEPEFLNIDQASRYLNLAKQTLYGFTSKGEIPYLKRGKKLYFKKTELTKWLDEGKKV